MKGLLSAAVLMLVATLAGCSDDKPTNGNDTTPPTVVSTTPPDEALNASVSVTLTATFSEEMDANSISNATFTISNGVTGAVSYGNKVASCDPSVDLAHNTSYTATISTGAKDAAGNAIAEPYSWSFTTESSSSSGDTTWEKAFWSGVETGGYSVAQGSDGNYLIGGYTYTTQSNVYLVLTDSTGDSLGAYTLGEGAAYVVLPTAEGGFIIAGGWSLIKVDNSGNLTWSKTYDVNGLINGYQPLIVRSVALSVDGGYVITGTTQSTVQGETDIYILKTTTNGDSVCARTFYHPGDDYSQSVTATSDGGYVIAGYTAPSYYESDVYIVKANNSCDSVWAKTHNYHDWDEGRSVVQTPDGGYLVAGRTGSFGYPMSAFDTCDVYLLKTDGDGNFVWQQTYFDDIEGNDDAGNCVLPTSDGAYVIAAARFNPTISPNIHGAYLVKVDGSGNQIRSKDFPNGNTANSVIETADGGIVFVGHTTSFGGYKIYFVKVNGDLEF